MNLDLCRRIAVRSPLRGSLSLEELSLSLAVARDPCPLEFFQALRLTKISILDVLPVRGLCACNTIYGPQALNETQGFPGPSGPVRQAIFYLRERGSG